MKRPKLAKEVKAIVDALNQQTIKDLKAAGFDTTKIEKVLSDVNKQAKEMVRGYRNAKSI